MSKRQVSHSHRVTAAPPCTPRERMARKSLRELVEFHEALVQEMARFEKARKAGADIDQRLYDHMVAVEQAYAQVMAGLKHLDVDDGRHALMVFADALQDLIRLMHWTRRRQSKQ